MQRKVEFYSIDFSFLPINSTGKSDEQIKKMFTSIMNQIKFPVDPYEVSYNESSESRVYIEIVESNDECLFGIISKVEDLKNGPLKRIKEKHSAGISDSKLESIGFTLENYTYFYLCKKGLYCSVISNSKAPKFKGHFQTFLREHIKNEMIEEINVYLVIDDKIDRKINSVRNITNLNLIFDDTSSLGQELLELKNAFSLSQSSLRRANISIDLKTMPITEDTKGIFRKIKDKVIGIEKFELSGFDNQEESITMELIQKILVKSVNIPINDTQLINMEAIGEIKKALKGSLDVI